MNKIKSYSVLFVLTVLISFCITSDLKAQIFELEKVEDTSTAIPMGTGNFTELISPVWIGDWDISFRGLGNNSQQGIYTVIDGTLSKVADINTAIPNGSGQFEVFGATTIWLGGKDIAFGASGTDQQGIYGLVDGVLLSLVDRNIAIPMGTGNFLGFGDPVALDEGNLAFRASGPSGQIGIYSYIDETIEKIVDTNTAIPMGTGNFTQFDSPRHLGDQDIVFRGTGSGDQEGIYTVIDGTLTKIADTNTAIPMGTGNFRNFGAPISLGGGDVAFTGFADGQGGLYRSINGTLSKVADFNTPIPMGTGNFELISTFPLSIGGGDLVFAANGPNLQRGLYSFIDGTLAKIADTNTPIPMGTGNFTSFSFIQISLGEGDIAFEASGEGQEGFYAFIDGNLIKVADDSTEIPMGTGNFFNFNGGQSTGAKDLVFVGEGSGQEGIYKAFFSYTLDIVLGGSGVGNVFAEGIDCGDGGIDCTENYPEGTEVTLTATPDAVSTFLGFSGDPDCEDGVVTMDANKNCIATFDFLAFLLGPIVPGVASNPNYIDVDQATPNGRVAYIWGFRPGSTIIGGPTCTGVEIGMMDPRLLGFIRAGADQTARFIVHIPNSPIFNNPVLVQAIDIPTCRISDVVTNIIINN